MISARNPSFFPQLTEGRTCTLRIYCRVIQWFSDNWPADLAWPSDIPRPAPTRKEEEAA